MRKYTIIYLLTISVLSICHAQNVYIPDANFKSLLLADLNINKNRDTAISKLEAVNFTGRILANVKFISSMKGIEAFVNLTYLHCSGNPFTEIDLSKNVSLQYLSCVNHHLTSLDLSNNSMLTYVSCSLGPLKNLEIGANQNLLSLYCSNNDLSSLNVSQTSVLANLECVNNPKLFQICVKSVAETSTNTNFVKDASQTWIQGCYLTGFAEDELPSSRFVYPNPARDKVVADANAVSSVFYNQIGMVVLKSNSLEIDIQELPAGVYHVHVNYPNHVVKQRLIKE